MICNATILVENVRMFLFAAVWFISTRICVCGLKEMGWICFETTAPAAIQWRGSVFHISQQFPWFSCHLCWVPSRKWKWNKIFKKALNAMTFNVAMGMFLPFSTLVTFLSASPLMPHTCLKMFSHWTNNLFLRWTGCHTEEDFHKVGQQALEKGNNWLLQ